jgi:GDP-4-dehydro-6-deoxy-D-mannose reductase
MSRTRTANRALVTGAAGFFGRHCCEALARAGFSVLGVDLVTQAVSGCEEFWTVDLTDGPSVDELLRTAGPTHVVHVAGALPGLDPAGLHKANVLTTQMVLEGLRKHAPEATTVVVGSAAEYGIPASTSLIRENDKCQPVSLYGLSKWFATQLALYYHRVHRIPAMVVRPFQLIGRGVSSALAPGAFAQRLREAARSDNAIKVGNLSSYRDFLDVRDAAEAITALLRCPSAGEIYNVCSGRPTRIEDLLQLMIREAGLHVRVEQGSASRDAVDPSCVVGSHDKISAQCGWAPRYQLVESVRSMGLGAEETTK